MKKLELHARLFEITALLQTSLKRLALQTQYGELFSKIVVECVHAPTGILDANGKVKMTVPHIPQWDPALQIGYAGLRIEAMQHKRDLPEDIPGIRLTGTGGMPLALMDQVFPYPEDGAVVKWMTEIAHAAVLFARWGVENNFKPELKTYYQPGGEPFGGTPQ